ncbi:MAG: hypothetical protein E5X25_01020 [Mesorhizobium sp.]|nr:MAG: hypothetical protein E5X25_01020 [Mesorhizobium sp.]
MFRAALDLTSSGGLLTRFGMSGSINCNRPSPELLLILEPYTGTRSPLPQRGSDIGTKGAFANSSAR